MIQMICLSIFENTSRSYGGLKSYLQSLIGINTLLTDHVQKHIEKHILVLNITTNMQMCI
jgi:hypothetical protein